MLVSLRGTLDHSAPGVAVIDVGGVGFRVLIPASTAAALPAVGSTAKLLTHLVVREDALILYGFATSAEIDLFERLLGVTKLGPAKALALLSGSTPAALRADIVRGNATALMRIPGIGRTLAAQIILDLKEKLGPVSDDPEITEDADLLTWLQAMGFSAAQAQTAVKRLPAVTRGEPLEDRVRVALSILRPD
ncbi:MAG: Holliday junction branch migration protein RuvA [Chloroflexi bacterium]|nr:Holliday junction branch migration protein RuvA [Chloroflexota bacterium]